MLHPSTETRQAVSLRPARRDERWLIVRRVLRERLDPTKLKWQRFVMAEGADGAILGFAQMKDWGEGVREFGSLLVEPAARGQGIGGKLLVHFLEKYPRPVYLFCGSHNVAYYQRFGFRRLPADVELPVPLRKKWQMARFMVRVFKAKVAVMVLDSDYERSRSDGDLSASPTRIFIADHPSHDLPARTAQFIGTDSLQRG